MTTAQAIHAQGTVTMTTSAETGTEIRMLINASSSLQPIYIDFGDGNLEPYTIDPQQGAWNRWIEGEIKGTTLRVQGNVTELSLSDASLTSATLDGCTRLTDLDLSDNAITSFAITSETPLESLNLSHNNVTNGTTDNPTLTLEYCGTTLTNLNLSYNPGLVCLDMRYLQVLEYLTITDCPDFGSIFICPPEGQQKTLRSISLSNCDLAHFYPVSLPALRSLSLNNNSLLTGAVDTDPFTLGDYPELTSLDIQDNPGISEIDLTSCTKLEQFRAGNCNLSTIDLSQAPNLTSLSVPNNRIAALDLGNNTQISSLNVSGNPISEVDFSKLPSISSVDISNTNISRADMLKAYYLRTFIASNSKLEFVDFNGVQPQRMEKIDLRNCPGFTYESMAYTVKTLPVARSSYSSEPNLLLSGSNADHADISYATNSDMLWRCDVTGDGSASYPLIPASIIDATDTGENKTGTLDRLYPLMGMDMDYDFDIYSTQGGEFLVCQWKPVWFQSMMSITNEIRCGVPAYIYPYPEEGMRFKSVTVNGKEIFSNWFMVDNAESAEIKVNFAPEEASISFTTTPGTSLSFCVNTTQNNGTIYIDWGTGTRTEYTGIRSYTPGTVEIGGRIDGSAASETITIYGDVAALDISGWGDAAELFGTWDNKVTSMNLSNSSGLKLLNAYFNPISEIDLQNAPELQVLDLSYTNLSSIDLSNNHDIMWLEAYSDGYGDEDEGIAQLSSIDVSNLPYLQYLDLKNNKLSSINLANNPYLFFVSVNNNALTQLDLSQNPELQTLRANGNKLSSIDLKANTELTELTIGDNLLTSIDLSANTALVEVSIANNSIHAADLSDLSELKTLYINGNGMSADELNDLYYQLPQRKPDEPDENGQPVLDYNLFVIQGLDKEENDGKRADSSIAVARGWNPTHVGMNAGSDVAYLDILPGTNGTATSVTDSNGNQYTHGSKVPKYTELTVNATPAPGYVLSGVILNGEETIEGNTFTMPGIYTTIIPLFKAESGIDAANTDTAIAITTTDSDIIVTANEGAAITVIGADGRLVASATTNADATTSISGLASGIYVVSVTSGSDSTTRKVVIR